MNDIFPWLESLRDNLWTCIGFPAILLLGLYFSFRSRFFQIRKFPHVIKIFLSFLRPDPTHRGIHPLGAFWTSLGGCVGIGNVVAICGAVQLGGPGALFWVWIAALLGMTLKYAEVFLGMKYRVKNDQEGYNGGPMYYLQKIFKTAWIPNIFAILFVIYGVEIYQFTVITNTLSTNFNINYLVITIILLVLVAFAGRGGIRRAAHLSSTMVPLFIISYLGMGFFVIYQNIAFVPEMLKTVFVSAFTGQAAAGGFVGSTMIMAVTQGVAQGCYSGDVGIGYASVIHSESSVIAPSKQACLTIFEIFIDTFVICTFSIFLILLTGVWKEPIPETLLIQTALSQYYPHMHIFMPFFLFLLGYSTIIAFFCVGEKCALYLSPRYGRMLFFIFALSALFLFSFVETRQTFIVMSFVGVLLLFINTYGMFRLREEVSFKID